MINPINKFSDSETWLFTFLSFNVVCWVSSRWRQISIQTDDVWSNRFRRFHIYEDLLIWSGHRYYTLQHHIWEIIVGRINTEKALVSPCSGNVQELQKIEGSRPKCIVDHDCC